MRPLEFLMIYSLRSGRCWRHRMAGSLRCPLHSGNAIGFMKREGAVRVPVSRSGCTDTGKCSIRHLSRASDRRCRYRADGPVPLGASILKETPTFPLVFETLEVELRDHKVLLRSAAMTNDIPARVDDKAFAEIEGLGGEYGGPHREGEEP